MELALTQDTLSGPAISGPRHFEWRAARQWFPVAVAGVMFLAYAWYSMMRQRTAITTAYDLGIFDQAIHAYAHFQAPIVPLKQPGFNLLGDHFHPILISLVPFYWVWPSAYLLLAAQAGLMAVSIIPVGRLAIGRLGTRPGAAVTVAYGLAWGIMGLVSFDFHEIAFAVPIAAFTACALAEERWRRAVAWSLLLLLVKEDLGVTVAAVGLYVFLKGQRRLGVITAVGGFAVMAVIVGLVIPALNPLGRYPYWGNVTGGSSFLHTIITLPATLLTPMAKVQLLLCVVGVTAGAALFSPIMIIAIPTLLWRLTSPYQQYWSVGRTHYNAILMPIVFVALIDAVPRLIASRHRWLRGYGRMVVPLSLVLALVTAPVYFNNYLVTTGFLDSNRTAAVRHVLGMVPNGARIAASNYLAPQLTDRAHVILFPRFTPQDPVDWVVVDTHLWGKVPPEPDQWAAYHKLKSMGFNAVARRYGIVLFHKG